MDNTVLIVEDESVIREAIAEVLDEEGFDVIEAQNGEEGLAMMRDKAPMGVLLDINMPVMDGWEFREQQMLDPALSKIPVIVITAGWRCAEVIQRMYPEGCLAKPFKIEALLNEVNRVFPVWHDPTKPKV